jgi:hypothetical protein
MEQWKASLKDRPASRPPLPYATRGFRNPDAVPAFHGFEITVTTKLSFDIRCFCQDNGIKDMHFGLAALQALLTQLTGTDDFVIGLGRVLKTQADVMPVRFKGDLQDMGAQLLEQTKIIVRDSHRHNQEPVKVLLKEIGVSKQTLLH